MKRTRKLLLVGGGVIFPLTASAFIYVQTGSENGELVNNS
jgi:hypothetical protein